MKRVVVTFLLFFCLGSAVLAQAEKDPLSASDMKQFAPHAVELGWKYFQDNDYETALRRFQMAIRHDKDFAPGYYGVAYVYSVQGKLDDAIKYYRETIKRDQTFPYAYANLGYALLQQKKYDEAKQMLDQALKLAPKCGEAHLSYAYYYAQKNDWENAGISARKAMANGMKLEAPFIKVLQENNVDMSE